MSAESLARWQFAITTVYHFFFVPITIGLSGLVAGLQTAWVRTGSERYLRLTRFFGKLFLINFAMGVVTGIVQEFQFGMNWSEYSRFVGDIFGAPLALEGLLAFFLESTFLGLWIFGWDRLPRRVHLACIWIVSVGTLLSAFFILAANSWMQHPVGFTLNEARGRAELTDFVAVLTNPVVLVTFPHQIFACYMVGGAFMAAIAGWHLHRLRSATPASEPTAAFRTALKVGAVTLLVSGLGVLVTGDLQGKVMTTVQPMKMAAAEALYETEQPAAFSIITIGSLDGSREVWSIKVPYLLSFLGTGDPQSEIKGINALQQSYEKTYGPGSYSPNIPLSYWTFRIMMGLGFAAMAAGAFLLWKIRRGRLPSGRLWLPLVLVLPFLPLLANSFGWIFTETGRQPWLVFGLLSTAAGVSPGTTVAEVLTSMITFTALYGVLAVVEVRLLITYIRQGLPEVAAVETEPADDVPLSFAY
ncbi:cytochrome d ubiquinol oxidase subunit I [Microlunatus panaciterrae]|uniref:Cytochrome d ubiquinol oxidase subunit I n=1 Tax=Microlunatus panaciterrae TaxID=400768 RepID=A0ABS2RII6_9ACTN|nr:cytochrome ubiquinol oxidase subunit I [Microlunatus panaciterrae]MBM7798810.1 cytochrome d ubiquinol oxidase subunit I [Microlunatus panaciterrae]